MVLAHGGGDGELAAAGRRAVGSALLARDLELEYLACVHRQLDGVTALGLAKERSVAVAIRHIDDMVGVCALDPGGVSGIARRLPIGEDTAIGSVHRKERTFELKLDRCSRYLPVFSLHGYGCAGGGR